VGPVRSLTSRIALHASCVGPLAGRKRRLRELVSTAVVNDDLAATFGVSVAISNKLSASEVLHLACGAPPVGAATQQSVLLWGNVGCSPSAPGCALRLLRPFCLPTQIKAQLPTHLTQIAPRKRLPRASASSEPICCLSAPWGRDVAPEQGAPNRVRLTPGVSISLAQCAFYSCSLRPSLLCRIIHWLPPSPLIRPCLCACVPLLQARERDLHCASFNGLMISR
jgi:hypothetical protein